MTVTTYTATFTDTTGKKFSGSIFSDKYDPKNFQARLCPHITALEVDYPDWTAKASNTREGMNTLVKRMKRQAAEMGLCLASEAESRFAPP